MPEQIHLYIVSLNGKFPENISAPHCLVPDGHSCTYSCSNRPATGKNSQTRIWPASTNICDVFSNVNSGILLKYQGFDSKVVGHKKNGSIHLHRLLPDSPGDAYFLQWEPVFSFFQPQVPTRNRKNSCPNWFACDVVTHWNWFG